MQVLGGKRPASQSGWAFDGVSVMPILLGPFAPPSIANTIIIDALGVFEIVAPNLLVKYSQHIHDAIHDATTFPAAACRSLL